MRRRSGGRRRPQDASTLALSGLFGTVPRRRWGGGRPLGGLRLGIACYSADTTAIAYPANCCKLLILLEPASGLEPLTC